MSLQPRWFWGLHWKSLYLNSITVVTRSLILRRQCRLKSAQLRNEDVVPYLSGFSDAFSISQNRRQIKPCTYPVLCVSNRRYTHLISELKHHQKVARFSNALVHVKKSTYLSRVVFITRKMKHVSKSGNDEQEQENLRADLFIQEDLSTSISKMAYSKLLV